MVVSGNVGCIVSIFVCLAVVGRMTAAVIRMPATNEKKHKATVRNDGSSMPASVAACTRAT